MKIALLNYSGNVGKTTLARDLFQYNLQDYELVTIESVNSDGRETTLIRGDNGDKIYTELLVQDNLILDIGSSNLENYLQNSKKESELISLIDKFVIPVTPEKKQQIDTAKTIIDLNTLGVPSGSINLVFNQVLPKSNLKDIFSGLTKQCATFSNIDFADVIYRHNLYSTGLQLKDLLSTEDFHSKILEAKNSGNTELARKYAKKYIVQKKVNELNETYQKIFNNIMGAVNA